VVKSNSTSRAKHRLTVKKIDAATLTPGQKICKLSDGAGLTLTLRNGADGLKRYWQLRYADPITGKEQTASLGTYPDVSLAAARKSARDIRDDLKVGITPKDKKREQKQQLRAARQAEAHTFQKVAEAWYQECLDDGIWSSDKYARVLREGFQLHVYPHIGQTPISEVDAAAVRKLVRRIARNGTWETAQRILQRIGTVFRWAEDEGLVEGSPTRPAQRWIKANRPVSTKERNYPALTPEELPSLAQALDNESEFMNRQTWLAIQLQALTFVRPGELRTAEWEHIDMEARLWEIPAENMKMKRPHLVLLSAPALAILRELKEISGNRKWVFPGLVSPRKCMSEGTVNMALKRLKPDAEGTGAFDGKHTGHSFRHTASTYLNGYRKGDSYPFRGDPVELQLAHLDRNAVRRRYNKSTLLDLRTEMMEVWGHFWLQCRVPQDKVVPIRDTAHV